MTYEVILCLGPIRKQAGPLDAVQGKQRGQICGWGSKDWDGQEGAGCRLKTYFRTCLLASECGQKLTQLSEPR